MEKEELNSVVATNNDEHMTPANGMIELLKAENRELRFENEFLEAIINSSTDKIVAYDTNLCVIAVNKKALEVYGLDKDEIMGKNLLEIFPQAENSKTQRDLLKALQGEPVHNAVYKSFVVDRYYENSIIPLKRNNKIYAVVLMAHDNTDLVIASQKLEGSYLVLQEKNLELEHSNNELASFTYIASHDLREPLRKIQAFGKRIMEKSENLDASLEEYFSRMIDAAGRMQILIDALLDFTRTAKLSSDFEEADLNLLLEEVKKDLSEPIEEKKAIIHADKLPLMRVIPFQFKQLMANMISNSLKYCKPDTIAEIRIQVNEISPAHIPEKNVTTACNFYRISVLDNGIGFEQEHASRIFELFQRLHGRQEYEGSGIGLAICKKIAENHRGFITAESTPGKGAAFHIFLPQEN